MNKAVMVIGFLALGIHPMITQADDLSGNGWYGAVSLGVSSYGNSQDDERTLEAQLAAKGIGAVATVKKE